MWKKIKCLFGFHEWEDVTHPGWGIGFRYTYRCKNCHKFKRDWFGEDE